MEKVTLKTIIKRVKSETPVFWKKIRKYMIWLGGLGIAVKTTIETHTMDITWLSHDIYNNMILIGAVGTAMAQLTAVPQKENEN